MKKCEDKALAYGEVTGHMHRATEKTAEVYERPDGVRELHAPCGTAIVHEEHGPISVPAGEYERTIVREYDPFEEEVREILD